METRLDILNQPEPHWMQPVEFFFSVIYMVEVAVKLMDTSWENYIAATLNKFDFFVSLSLFCAGMSTLVPAVAAHADELIPYLNILRMMRLLQFLDRVEAFSTMVACIKQLIQISVNMFLLLYTTTAIFAIVAVQGWGGKLYESNPVLKGTDYIHNEYYVINFHDYAQSFVALFNMMVTAYMPEY